MTAIQIDCFLAAAATGSFAAAAKELYLSARAVGQHVRAMEKELSRTLFIRQSEGLELTPDGYAFLSAASRWKGLYRTTMLTIRERYQEMARHLRVGISEYIDPLGPISGGLAAFADDHRDVAVRARQYGSGEILQAVGDGAVDAVLISGSQIVVGGDYDIYPIATEELHLFVCHVPDLPDSFTLADIAALPESLPHFDASFGPWTPEEWREISGRTRAHLGIERNNTHTFTSFRSAVASARSARCTIVSDVNFGYLQAGGELRSIPLHESLSLCCVTSKRNENPLIPEFRAYMRSHYMIDR